MKNTILSIAFMFALVVGTINNAAAQAGSALPKVVVITSGVTAAKAGLLQNLANGTLQFDNNRKAFVAKPADNSDKTLANLIAEIKNKLPEAQLKTIELTSDKK